jgi:hypothetical protein
MNLEGLKQQLGELLFDVPADVTASHVWARGILLAGLAVWGGYFVTRPIAAPELSQSVLYFVNTPFHEAGHIIFAIMGDFMSTAGGTLMQILMPAICAAVFLFKEYNPFGASVATWWMGQSIMSCAPYAADAQSQQLILLGGVTGREVPGYHDWNNMLGRLDLLAYDQVVAGILHFTGAALIVAAIAWGAYLLVLSHRAAGEREEYRQDFEDFLNR